MPIDEENHVKKIFIHQNKNHMISYHIYYFNSQGMLRQICLQEKKKFSSIIQCIILQLKLMEKHTKVLIFYLGYFTDRLVVSHTTIVTLANNLQKEK